MSDVANAVQKAIYGALTAGSPAAVSCPVYDGVPAGAAYPYVSIDSQQSNQTDYLTERMEERFIYLSVWSRARGQKEVQEILAQIDTALHRVRLPLDAGTMISSEVIRSNTLLDADAVTYMGTLTLKVRTQH